MNYGGYKQEIATLKAELKDCNELIEEFAQQIRYDCFNRHSITELIELHREYWNTKRGADHE